MTANLLLYTLVLLRAGALVSGQGTTVEVIYLCNLVLKTPKSGVRTVVQLAPSL